MLQYGGVGIGCLFLGFHLGVTFTRKHFAAKQPDCFYCHECILCKRDVDASYCRSKDIACVKCIARFTAPKKQKKAGYMGNINGVGADPDTV